MIRLYIGEFYAFHFQGILPVFAYISMVKFQVLSQFRLDNLPRPVIPVHEFINVINYFISISHVKVMGIPTLAILLRIIHFSSDIIRFYVVMLLSIEIRFLSSNLNPSKPCPVISSAISCSNKNNNNDDNNNDYVEHKSDDYTNCNWCSWYKDWRTWK